ncbi:MAG: DUF5615 family PIN-like protein [Chloroflexaceae bacterium]|nr:DUF5615 family PIN-like protein [Chloroflexaceae bacterium]
MKVLLDECLPRKLKYDLPGHTVSTVPEMGWAGTKNSELLRLAESAFEVFVTADQNVEYQQNLRSTMLGIVVLVAPNNRLATLRPLMPKVALALATIQPGDLVYITA